MTTTASIDRQALEAPFAPELIKTRQGSHGKRLSYVEGHAYIKRLNEVFDSEWSFEVVSYQVLETEVIVQGRITAGGLVKEAFGGQKRQDGAELADVLKGASTDALKKAASLFGVGLHLYSDNAAPKPRPQRPQRAAQKPASRPVGGQAAPAPSGGSSTPRAATTKQLGRMRSLARELRRDEAWLIDKVKARYGVMPTKLTKAQASEAIDCLMAGLDNLKARAN